MLSFCESYIHPDTFTALFLLSLLVANQSPYGVPATRVYAAFHLAAAPSMQVTARHV